MKFNELKNEDAIKALADLMDPVAELAQDPELVQCIRQGNKIAVVQLVLRNHSKAIFDIMAKSEGVDPEEYECNMLTLPAKLFAVLESSEFTFLFPMQSQTEASTSSGSATENTQESEN